VSMVWLVRSVWPSLWGWYAVEALDLTPRCESRARQNFETNAGPRSDTMD
ncbi:hypothetical protein EXIGLDRAFT_615952, partial [Exidia glandulosa HHB12029]